MAASVCGAQQRHLFPRRQYGLPQPSEAPRRPELCADEQTIETMLSADYWRLLCPDLHVDGASLSSSSNAAAPTPLEVDSADVAVLHGLLEREGYFTLDAPALGWPPGYMERLARGVVALLQHGWPAAFIAMYDEAWWVCHAVGQLMESVTGGNRNNMDFLAWYIDPGSGDEGGGEGGGGAAPPAAGFAPHRDRQPRDIAASFRQPGGEAKYLTCWLPFTDACPENSCLYLIPRGSDPAYLAGDSDMEDPDADPMEAAVRACPRRFQDIRALPTPAGGAVFFTHRVIHWGSAARAGYPTPRIACSWAATADDYEQPYFSRSHLPLPAPALRAALCAGQQMNYVKRFRPERHRLDLYNRVFMSRAAEFASQYRAKVQAEYQWAKFEHARQRSAPTRRRKQQPPPPPPQPEQLQVTARAGSTTADPQEQEEEPAPDLEEELQGMFGGAGLSDEDEFESEAWDGEKWVAVDRQHS